MARAWRGRGAGVARACLPQRGARMSGPAVHNYKLNLNRDRGPRSLFKFEFVIMHPQAAKPRAAHPWAERQAWRGRGAGVRLSPLG